MVKCQDQAEVDAVCDKFVADGGKANQCGWIDDKFGVYWQIIPVQLGQFMSDSDLEKSSRVTLAMLKMNKIIIADLEKAHSGI